MGARPTLSTRDSRLVNSTFTGHDSTLCPAMWMDHIYPVVVRPGRPHVDARASEADDARASEAFGRRGTGSFGARPRARVRRARRRGEGAGTSTARSRDTRGRIRGASEGCVERDDEGERVGASEMDAERGGARERGGRETTRSRRRRGEGGEDGDGE